MGPIRLELLAAYDAALAAVDPRVAVARSMSLQDGVLRVGSHTFNDVDLADVVVVAIGKAAAGMARGAYEAVGSSRGLVVTTHSEDSPYRVIVGAHPIPDASSSACGASLLAFVEATRPSDVLVFLVSGGGSAVAVAPVDGVSVDDLSEMNTILIASGMPIEEINTVRASVSRIKGGGLAGAAGTNRQATLILSDIVGGDPAHTASGPSTGFRVEVAATGVVRTYGLQGVLPDAVLAAIDRFSSGEDHLTLPYDVVGSSEIAAEAAVRYLRSAGLEALIATSTMKGESVEEAFGLIESTPVGTISVAAGETTVKVHGSGVGGRNQEAALAAAMRIDGQGIVFAALGTDGIDGPTKAAGAVVDGTTAAQARELGLDLAAALADNDSHTVLAALGETVVTGPSGTNVADLWMVARGPFPERS